MGVQFIFFVVEAESNSSSSPVWALGPVYLKLVTQDASELRFRRSIYGWKANLIRKIIQVVSHQKTFGINRNRRNKSTSRICQGAATPSFGLLDCVSCLGPLGARPGVLHDPRVFINSHHSSIRVWVLLRLFYQEQFHRSSICEILTREINHTSAIWLLSFLFLLMFFIAQAGISLLGEVNLVRDSVDNQRSCGAKIVGFDLSI